MVDKTQAKRQFLSVDVGEISLVDEPANESPIAVMKRKEQDEMNTPAEASPTAPAAEQPSVPVQKDATETVEMEAGEDTPESVLKQLQSIGETITALVTKGTEEAETEKAGKGGGKLPPFMAKAEEEKTKKASALRKQLESAGLDKAAIDKAVKAAFGDSGLGVGSDKKPVKKALDEDTAFTMLDTLQDAITKAKKFTPKRVNELRDVVTKLNALLGEVTTEHPDKAAFGASGIPAQGTVPVAVPQLADTTGAGAPGTPGNAITKSTADALSEAVAKALGPLAEAVNALGGRVESIEKSRTPSTAQPEGETEGEPVKKSAPLWSGVL